MSENCVVIPIYKSVPDEWELISFVQCLKVLRNQDIYIVTYAEADLSIYNTIASENKKNIDVIVFDKAYFNGIIGYNFLMLSKVLYKSFEKYNYILVYQLDCFVFEDRLDYWANKGYDYIGSPWFVHYMDYAEDRPFWYNGNGGFSIRKIKSFLDVLNWKWPLNKMPEIKYELESTEMKTIKKKVLALLMWFGYHNNITHFWKKKGYDPKKIEISLDDGKLRANEDVLWSNMFRYTRVPIISPDLEGGLGFSFERSPRYLYEQNNFQLPFGCHAWKKYDLDFWKPFIESYGYDIPVNS